ncbi:MAG: hypothetical protein JW863_02320 [Chitinispirillaceae bacterium]|nr:hypothetical protein [Chitinispirillaceae bacterium]
MPMDKDSIARILNDKGATHPCHRCGSVQFAVADGYSALTMQDDFKKGLVLGGKAMPVAVVICKQCGAVTTHALAALGINPKDEL